MKNKNCQTNALDRKRFSCFGMIRSGIIFGILLFCLTVAVRDAFRPGLACLVHLLKLENLVGLIRARGIYSDVHDLVDLISQNLVSSKSIIGIIGLSGTAVQALSDVSVSMYPGLEKRTVFRWRYPGYVVLYLLHICLVLLGEYSVDARLERCAIFCQIGLMVSFGYSLWIMIISMVPKNTQKFMKPYIVNRVKAYKRVQKTMPAKGSAMYDGLLYRLPAAAYGMDEQFSGLNRHFEDLILRNGALWNDLLGDYSEQAHARQAKACSWVLQIVAQQCDGDDFMLPAYFSCGLLLWLQSSIPHIFSAERSWELITQFLADIPTELHRTPEKKEREELTDGIAYGFLGGEHVSVEVCVSMIALNLLYIENILWRPMSEEALSRVAKRLEKGICQNHIRPHFAMEQRYGFLACAMMVYQALTYFTYDHMILPSRKMVDSLVEYMREAVRL